MFCDTFNICVRNKKRRRKFLSDFRNITNYNLLLSQCIKICFTIKHFFLRIINDPIITLPQFSPFLISSSVLLTPSSSRFFLQEELEVGGFMSWQSDCWKGGHLWGPSQQPAHAHTLHNQSSGSVCVCAVSSCKSSRLLL